jgi:hypothetical protein
MVIGYPWYGSVFGKKWMGMEGITRGNPSRAKIISSMIIAEKV